MIIKKDIPASVLIVGFAILTVMIASVAFAQIAYAANTYQYVDINGNLASVIASNSSEALATAVNRAPESGVMLVSSNSAPSVLGASTGGQTYMYVDINGAVQTVEANSSQDALNKAPNRAPESGVALI